MSALEPLLTPQEIASLVGCSYDGVLRDIRSGKLKATRKSKGYRVTREWYEAWLAADVVAPTAVRPAAAPRRRRVPAPAGSVAALRAIEQEEAV